MGSSISVYFVITFMAHRLSAIYRSPPPDLLYLTVYLDDIIGIWRRPDDHDSVKRMFSTAVDDHIALTFDFGDLSLTALDTRITIAHGAVHTTVRKPTDGQQYLH